MLVMKRPHCSPHASTQIAVFAVCNRLKKVSEEQKEEKADPMLEMMQRIRSGNVNLKKVAPPPQPAKKGGGVMAEMAQLLVSGRYLPKLMFSISHVGLNYIYGSLLGSLMALSNCSV